MTDTVKIIVKAGDGGDGAVSFHREKFVTRGGPDGGDGGRGGSVFFVADNNTSTLDDFKSRKVFGAQNGEAGKKLKMYGKNAEDVFIKVPAGTLVFEVDGEQKRLISDLTVLGTQFMVAQGGRGGKGNYRFKSSTNQTPVQYVPGELGEKREVVLELKLIADVGLVGLPSAGKSTLINTLAHINAKVANYPFTTLEPNLGVWELEKGNRVVVADIPGLIEGASTGKGLGDDFLRHIERTKVIVHVVDPVTNGSFAVEPRAVFNNYQTILAELKDYKGGLWDISNKPQIAVINKVDITEVRDVLPEILEEFKSRGVNVLPISAATGEGVDSLRKSVLEALSHVLDTGPIVEPPVKKYNVYNLPGLRRRPVLTKDVKGLV